MRLDKYLSHCTQLTRKQSRAAIKAGSITINGSTINEPGYIVPQASQVLFDGNVIDLPKPRYFMLHKPLGVVSASSDGDHPCATDLLAQQAPGLQVAGRLDMDASGLLLLSDNGDWIHQVISPHKHCEKIYTITTDKTLPETANKAFAEGMMLRGEEKPTQAAQLEFINERTYQVVISEGRYHQIKRMIAACGAKVCSLHRTQIGAICLDASLRPGQYRALHSDEINSVYP